MGDPSVSEATLLAMDAGTIEAQLYELSSEGLEVLIRRANREYWDDDAPTLPDPLYDRMIERLRVLAPDAAVLDELGPTPSSAPALEVTQAEELDPHARFGASVRHNRPMLSLDKCYTEEDLLSWAAKFEGEIMVMPKLDGIALSLRFDSTGRLRLAATRGSGTEGEDVTANVLEIDEIPRRLQAAPGEIEVRGELYMRLSTFQRFSSDFANPRNLTAGAIKHKQRERSRAYDLSFFAYDLVGSDAASEREKMALMQQLGLPVVEHEFVERDAAQAGYEAWSGRRSTLDYEIDGVVYRAASVAEQARLGATAHHPRSAIAYKFQGDSGETRIRDVMWSVSRTGTITPTAVLEPIELSGAMIGKAGLHNLTRFRELHLTRGAMLEVTRRGGVIPHVERVVSPGPDEKPFEIPTHCPACGTPVVVRKKREGEFLMCSRPEQCVVARLRELEHFATVVDIQGFGPKVIAQIVDAGLLSSPADYYRLEPTDLIGLERLGEKSAHNLVDQIDAHRDVPLATFLEALGIEHLGSQNSILLATQFRTLDRVREVTRETLMEVKGIKGAIADSIVAGLEARAGVINDLLGAGVTVSDARAPDPAESTGGGPWSGKSFLFTGTLEAFDRKTAQQRVRDLGGETPSGVSRGLTYLVIGAGRAKPSSKQRKAESLRDAGAALEIITEQEFVAMVDQVSSTDQAD